MEKGDDGVWTRDHAAGRPRVPLLLARRGRRRGQRPRQRDLLRLRQADERRSRSPRRASTSTTRRTCRTARCGRSGTLEGDRQAAAALVYTPPGYDTDADSSTRCCTCSTGPARTSRVDRQGRANFILDNLIAAEEGRADDRRDGQGLRHAGRCRGRAQRQGVRPAPSRSGAQGPDPDDRRDLPHGGGPGQPGDRRAVDGRRAGAADRADPPGHVRLVGAFSGAGQVRREDVATAGCSTTRRRSTRRCASCTSAPAPAARRGIHKGPRPCTRLQQAGVKNVVFRELDGHGPRVADVAVRPVRLRAAAVPGKK